MNLFSDESSGAIPRGVVRGLRNPAGLYVLEAPIGIFRGGLYAKFHAIRQANFPVNCYFHFRANFTTNSYGKLEGEIRANLHKKKDPSDTPMQFSTRLFTHYSMQRSTLRSMGRASQNSMQLSTGRPARRSIAQYAQITMWELLTMLRCRRHANFYARAFRRSYHDNTYMGKFRSNIKKNKTISTRCSAESFARTPMQQ